MTAVVEFNLQTGRPVCMSFTLEGRGENNVPIPSNANLKKERSVCVSFTLEGHGDLNVKLNYGVVLLLGVESLMVGSTTGLLMFTGHGGDQATAAKEYYTTPPPYYATKSTYATSTYNTEAPQVLHHQGSRVTLQITLPRVTSPKRLSTTTEAAKYYVAQAYNTAAAPSYYVELKYYTKAAVNYTTTYATPSYYDEAPNYYTEEATCYTSTYSAPVYYTEEPKYYSAPSYYQTEAPFCYTKATEYYTTTKRYYTTKATEYYTTSYAATTFYTEAPKFYSVLSYHTIKEAEHYTTNASATYYMEIPKC
ncbi:hypothetical protein DAPPUDRAFT_235695 [Daphnia pulex]|uniref:Uncharacterized protein n=1 Tax=Daphnia pulex TaxID=6669 RepID=E9G0K3_DAPPU|nr:hypothetical protein DAPPUDRAFT_235695 [Daphnia pulex]|eukprot:EFX87387.1 hypothetical protein DAPPUDRAFT_235695 [Daphnia pulex]